MKLFSKTNFCALGSIIVVVFSACRGPEAKEDTTHAPVSAASLSQAPRENYFVDPKETVIKWYCSMLVTSKGSHHGFVSVAKGDLVIQHGQLAGGIIEVDMNSIADENHGTSNNLVDHLKSPDFFEVEKFPTATFAVLVVTPATDSTVNVRGNLTIKGITEDITFPARVAVKDGVVNATARLTIDRTKFDVRYKSGKFFSIVADEVISDAIEFDVKIVARK